LGAEGRGFESLRPDQNAFIFHSLQGVILGGDTTPRYLGENKANLMSILET
jgi:hypothetical protein